MNSVLVLSCGRTGTNMLLESLTAEKKFKPTSWPQDANCIKDCVKVHENYLSKSDTHYINNLNQVQRFMENNPNLLVLWTIRDLRDVVLSKIYRGQPGNDSNKSLSDDASFNGCLESIDWMVEVYKFIKTKFPKRIFLVKMEDMILDYENTIKNVCKFCNIEYNKNMRNFTERYRGSIKETKGKRYSGIDSNQIALHERKYEIYDGFYLRYNIDLNLLFKKVYKHQKFFGYEE
jgi:hypothetical protein